MSQESHPSSATAHYVTIWVVLILSLGALMAIHALGNTLLTVSLIVALATVNATLMFSFFMHLTVEPRTMRWLVIIPAVVVLILLITLVPDIVWVYGRK